MRLFKRKQELIPDFPVFYSLHHPWFPKSLRDEILAIQSKQGTMSRDDYLTQKQELNRQVWYAWKDMERRYYRAGGETR